MALDDFTDALDSTGEIEITVKGRKSGREISNPIWFARHGDILYLLPVTGSASDWFRNVRKTPHIRLTADGQAISAQAKPIADRAKVAEIAEKFRDKYSPEQVEAYYSRFDAAVEVPLR